MHSQFVPTTHLTAGDRQSMIALLNRHFDGVDLDVFEADLTQKNWVLLLRDQHSDELKGFSTLRIYETKFQGKPISVIYSGDTVMDPSAWSSPALARSWISAVKHLRQHYPNGKFYWLLISSGYRTYRFLPIFWRTFYPRYDSPTPPDVDAIMTFLAGKQFGKLYHKAEEIVRFPNPQRLKGMLQGIPEERKTDPHIRFFEQKNPGHLQGDELVCIAEICEQNLTRAGKRMWFGTSSSSLSPPPLTHSRDSGTGGGSSNPLPMLSSSHEMAV
ncbi:MAG TPA: hypothetical protein ACFE0H_11885 [Elainellaceae cyanobacterium]|jgi:hypothetical protein